MQESVDVGGRGSRGEVQLQKVGKQLFDAVFSGEVGTAYRSSYAVASERNDKLRLVLRLSDARLASLPWEAMYDTRNDEYVCRNEPLVRYVEATSVPIPLAITPPLRILGVVSSPSDMPALAVDDEKARLSDALEGLTTRDSSTSNGLIGQIGTRCTPSSATKRGTWCTSSGTVGMTTPPRRE